MAKSDLLAGLISGQVSNLSTKSGPDYQDISLEQLRDNPKNFFPVDETSVRQLAESIQISGIQQPPVVTPAEDGSFRLVAGHRRTAAVRLLHREHPEDARWNSITCRVSRYSSPEAEELALIVTNTEVRQQSWEWTSKAATRAGELLVKLQEEQGIKMPGRTRDRVAELLKISRAKLGRAQYIEKHLRPEVREKFPALAEQTATEIAHLPEEQQLEIAKRYRKKLPPSKAEVQGWKSEWEGGQNPFDRMDAERKAEAQKKAEEGPKKQCPCVYGGYGKAGYIPKKDCETNRKGCTKNDCCRHCAEELLCESRCTLLDSNRSAVDRLDDIVARRLAKVDSHVVAHRECLAYFLHSGTSSNRLPNLVALARDNHISLDYIFGLTDNPSPIGWQRITVEKQPLEGKRIVLACYSEDMQSWIVTRSAWMPSLYNESLIQMWIDLPELP